MEQNSITPQIALGAFSWDDLIGKETRDGWEIVVKLPQPGSEGATGATGGCFSVGFIAQKNGRKAELAPLI